MTKSKSNKISVLQLGSPMGLYGAERWILALVKHLDPNKVESIVSVIKDSPSLDAPLCREAQKLGIKTHVFEGYGKINFSVIKQIRDYIKKNNIQIIHSHFYKTDIIALFASIGTGCRTITTPHGWSTNAGIKLWCYEFIDRCIFPFFNAVVPLSNDLYDSIGPIHRFSYAIISKISKTIRTMSGTLNQRLNDSMNLMNQRTPKSTNQRIPESTNKRINESNKSTIQRNHDSANIHLIKNGVDISEIDSVTEITPKLQEWKNEDVFIIGYVGQIIPRKGLDTLLRAVAKFENIKWKVAIVGEGEERARLEKLAKELKIDDSIHFFGFRADRLLFIKGFNVFALPSRLEGIPRCLMEAMAAGTPIIASDIPGCTDLIDNGKTGLLFNCDDADMLAAQITKLAKNRQQGDLLSKNARDFVIKHYSAERMAREYEMLYTRH